MRWMADQGTVVDRFPAATVNPDSSSVSVRSAPVAASASRALNRYRRASSGAVSRPPLRQSSSPRANPNPRATTSPSAAQPNCWLNSRGTAVSTTTTR